MSALQLPNDFMEEQQLRNVEMFAIMHILLTPNPKRTSTPCPLLNVCPFFVSTVQYAMHIPSITI